MNVESEYDIEIGYANKNKDVVIYANNTNTDEYITLKNFGSKDVLNNATKTTADTSSAEIRFNPDDADDYTINLKDMPVISNVTGNFTGTWMNDFINAYGYEKKDKKGNLITDYSKKGLTIKGGDGANKIIGSKYSDVIYAGNNSDEIYGAEGNDTIIAGKGKTIVYYNQGDGNDVIDMSKAKDVEIKTCLNDETLGNAGIGYSPNHKDLRIYFDRNNETEYLTLKNFCVKDTFGNVTLTSDDLSYEINLKDQFMKNDVSNKNYTGTWLKDYIDVRSYAIFKDKAKTIIDTNYAKKGLSLNAKEGDDSIQGSNYSDTIYGGAGDDYIEGGAGNDKIYAGVGYDEIYGGDGNDTIYGDKGTNIIDGGDGDDVIYGSNDKNGFDSIVGGAGNDTITGGKGLTWVTYNDGDGKDVINLTKGEDLYIIDKTTNTFFPKLSYSDNKKDLIITFNSDEQQSITLKNFASKNVANAVMLNRGSATYNLLDNEAILSPVYITTQNVNKNYTGTWMRDAIYANEAYLTKTIKVNGVKETVEKSETDKGLTLDGGAGSDSIWGSKYSDTIKGGDGNDLIYGEAGNDVIYGGAGDDTIIGGKGNDTLTGGAGSNYYSYQTGDGIDTINLTKGEDLLVKIQDTNNYHVSYINGNKDIKIKSEADADGYIILKNFGGKDITNSAKLLKENGGYVDLKTVTVNATMLEKSFTGTWLNDNIDARYATKSVTLRGGDGNDSIFGGNSHDKIYGDNGNDTIRGAKGNDTITGGKGENHIMYKLNDGNDVINLTKGEDFYLHFENVTNVNNAQWEFKGNDLRIWAYGKNASEQFVTIKNAKKMIDKTDTAKIIINDSQQLDLKTLTDADVNSWKSQITAWSATETAGYSLAAASMDTAGEVAALAAAFTTENYGMV